MLNNFKPEEGTGRCSLPSVEAEGRSILQRARGSRLRAIDASEYLRWKVRVSSGDGLRSGALHYVALPDMSEVVSDARRQGYVGQVIIEGVDVVRVKPRRLALLSTDRVRG